MFEEGGKRTKAANYEQKKTNALDMVRKHSEMPTDMILSWAWCVLGASRPASGRRKADIKVSHVC